LKLHNFTYAYYDQLLSELKKPQYLVLNVSGFIQFSEKRELPPDKVIVILRHDVDDSPDSAAEISRMENRDNITSTYYIRTRGSYDPLSLKMSNWIKWLNQNGFEVGLHYEDLYIANYDFAEAVRQFKMDLQKLREISKVITVCSHGNEKAAMQKYVNYEIFKQNYTTLEENSLVGEAYLTVDKYVKQLELRMKYLSDSGGKWQPFLEVLTNATGEEVIYFLLHPEWWHKYSL